MAHEVETMFSVGETPWHGLGEVLETAPATSAEAIKLAGLDWTVEVQTLFAQNGEDDFIQLPDQKATVRANDRKVLGVVGNRYEVLQNVDAFAFFDPFIDSGLLEYETAGSLKEGAVIWILARVTDGTAEVVKNDPISAYVLLSHSHDGSMAVQVRDTNIRVVCANTLSLAGRTGKALQSIRHTATLHDRVDALQDVVAQRREDFEQALEQYRFLAGKTVNEEKLRGFIRSVFATSSTKPDRLPKGTRRVLELFESGRGQDNPKVKGTLWAAYNAVTEYVDHERGSDDRAKRLQSAWFGNGAEIKAKALNEAIKLAA